MSAHVGIEEKFGLTTPATGYAQETRRKSSAEFVPVKNESGVTVDQVKLPYTKATVSMRGVGVPDFSIVAAAVKTDGQLLVHEVDGTEENQGVGTFSISGEVYTNDETEEIDED